jgi:hypothetical protein
LFPNTDKKLRFNVCQAPAEKPDKNHSGHGNNLRAQPSHHLRDVPSAGETNKPKQRWQELQMAFKAGQTPRQLFSDDEIAATAAAGQVTVTATGELYRCSFVGPK